MRTQVRFRTSLFRPLTGDDDQSENGRELFEWLCAKLPPSFRPSGGPEDWGYLMDFASPQIDPRISLCCGHVEADQWSCFVDVRQSFSEKLFRKPLDMKAARPVVAALDELIASEQSFVDVEWFESDNRLREFNHGARAFS